MECRPRPIAKVEGVVGSLGRTGKKGKGGLLLRAAAAAVSPLSPLVDYGRKQGRDSPREAWEKWTNFVVSLFAKKLKAKA